MEDHFDVIIVGAGPAGCSTSYFLSKHGIKHALLDKSEFPRDKVCGDAISGKTIHVLQQYDKEWANAIFDKGDVCLDSWGLRIVSPKLEMLEIPFSLPGKKLKHAPGIVSKRIDFDNLLVNKLDDRYCTFIQGANIKSIGRNGSIEIDIESSKTGLRKIRSEIIVGADGARSIVKKTFLDEALDRKHHCAGVRAYYSGIKGMHEKNYIELHFLKEVSRGYFWIFPLPDGKANIGLGILSKDVSEKKINLKKCLRDIVRTNPLLKERFGDAEQIGNTMGWGLPMGSKKRTLVGDRVLLTGDAASLIDPFTGEGIGNAVISGKKAAEMSVKALAEKDFSADSLKEYEMSVYHSLWQELTLSHVLQRLLKYPFLFNFIVHKANRNKTLKEMLINMFVDIDIRHKLKSPSFYFKLLFN